MLSFLSLIVVVMAALFCIEVHAFSRMSSQRVTYDYLKINTQLRVINDDVPPEVISSVSDLVSNMAAGKLEKEVFEEQIAEKAKIINQARDQRSKALQVATLVGSGVAGLTVGLVSDVAVGDAINPAILPVAAAALLSGGAYYAQSSQSSSPLQPLLIDYIGTPTLSVGESISKSIQDVINKQQQALNKKKEDTISYIESIPIRIQESVQVSFDNAKKQAVAKVDNTNRQIANIPNAIAQYFAKLADDTKASINRKAQETVADIQATPQRVAKKISNAFDSLVLKIKAVPSQVAQRVTGAVDTKTKEAKKALNQKISSVQSSVIKAVPKVPNVSIPLPAIELPAAPSPAKNSPPVVAAKAPPKPVPVAPPAAVATVQKAPAQQEKAEPIIKLPPLPAVTLPSIPLPQISLPSKEDRPVVPPKASVTTAVATKPKPTPVAPSKVSSPVSSSSSVGPFGSLFGGESSSVKAAPKSAAASAAAATAVKNASVKVSSPASKPVALSAIAGLFSFGPKSKPPSAPSKSTEKPPATAAVDSKPATVAAKSQALVGGGLFSFGAKSNASPVPNKPAPSPVKETKAAAPAAPKSLFSFGSVSTPKQAPQVEERKGAATTVVKAITKPSLLSSAAIKTLKSVKANDAEIAKVDSYLQTFSKGGVSAEKLYAQVANALGGNKSNAFTVLPDLIGSLPKGTTAKSALNSFYQQKA